MASHAVPACLVVLMVAVASGACAARPVGPQVVQLRDLPTRPTYDPSWIRNDRDAAAVAMAVMHQELGLPRLEVALHFLPGREALRQALLEDGYTPALAEQAAARMDAIGGHRRVYFNAESLGQLQGAFRAAFMAHELTHVLQYELGGGVRGTSAQWLREGFADWIAGRVIDVLGAMPRGEFERQRVSRYRGQRPGAHPGLARMATFPDWVALSTATNAAAVSATAFLAVSLLLERRGLEPALDYFTRFATSDDPPGNFRAAFGESVEDFEAAFEAHLRTLR